MRLKRIFLLSLCAYISAVHAGSLSSLKPSPLKDCQEYSETGALHCRFDVSESMVSGEITNEMKQRAKDNWKLNQIDGKMTAFTFNISDTEKTTYYITLDKNGDYKFNAGSSDVGIYTKDPIELKLEFVENNDPRISEGERELARKNSGTSSYLLSADKKSASIVQLDKDGNVAKTIKTYVVDDRIANNIITRKKEIESLGNAYLKNKKVEVVAEEKILDAIIKTYAVVKEKSDQEFKHIYAEASSNVSGEQTKASPLIVKTLSKVKVVNEAKNKITNSLGRDTKILLGNIALKLQDKNNVALMNSLKKAQNVQLELMSDSDKSATVDTQLEKDLFANTKISNELNSNTVSGTAVKINKDKVEVEKRSDSLKVLTVALSTGKTDEYIKYQNDLASTISKNGLESESVGRLLNPSLSVADVRLSSGQIKKTNELQGKKDFDKVVNSNPSNEKSVVNEAFVSSPVFSMNVGTSVDKKPYRVERPEYQLKKFYEEKNNGDPANTHAIFKLKMLEEKISYDITNVNEVNLSTSIKRLEKKMGNEDPQTEVEKVARYILFGLYLEEYRHSLPPKSLEKDIALGTVRAKIYNQSKGFLQKLYSNAQSACPNGMILNATWQSIVPGGQGAMKNICQTSDKKGLLFSFGGLPEIDPVLTSEKGEKEYSYSYFKGEKSLPVGQFICPESIEIDVFGKKLPGNFSSVIYYFNGYTTSPIKSREHKDSCAPREEGKEYRAVSDNNQERNSQKNAILAKQEKAHAAYMEARKKIPNLKSYTDLAEYKNWQASMLESSEMHLSSAAEICTGNEFEVATISNSNWGATSFSKVSVGNLNDISCNYRFEYKP